MKSLLVGPNATYCKGFSDLTYALTDVDLNLRSNEGQTSLDLASIPNHDSVLEMQLAAKMDLNIKESGENILSLCVGDFRFSS